jgi:two-component system, NtrC family, nitrogen regulation response regulator NtrX
MAHDILIVDDEIDIRMLIGGVLKDEGYATREAADTAQALAAIQARQPTLVILDIWLQDGGLEGIEILRQIRADMPSVPVVMISGHGTIETAVEAIKIGAYDSWKNRSNRIGFCWSSSERSKQRSLDARMRS